MDKKFGICFSKELKGTNPLKHIVGKLAVYLRFLELCQEQGWETYVLTRKTYQGNGIFGGGWLYNRKKFSLMTKDLQLDVVYDRTGGINFPLKNDNFQKIVNTLDFKILCWNKWATYQEIGQYMPKTIWVGKLDNLGKLINNIATSNVVLKPYNGLKGMGIYIGKKEGALKFKPDKIYQYILQEFVDTSAGLAKITSGRHDLRIVIVNSKPVWCHIRIPPKGSFLANAARGGTLIEVDYAKVPASIKKIVEEISQSFYKKYDNPVYSLDFGMDKNGVPKIFEINDQIGFPKWEMKNREKFLNALAENFKSRL